MKRFVILAGFALALLAQYLSFVPGTAPNPSDEGAYEALPPRDQKIADAIYEAQLGPGTDSPDEDMLLTHDEIAAMKASGRWDLVYSALYEEGKVTFGNLRLAISSYNRSLNLPPADGPTLVPSGYGHQVTAER